MRRLLLLALPLILACRGGESAPSRRTLIDSRDLYDPRSLDPSLSTDVPTGRAVGYLFDGLVRFTPDAQVEPGLAERWEVAEDGLTYTFHLRRGVTFHDSTPFVARHVVKSFERVLDPTSRGGRAWPLLPIRGADEFASRSATSIAGVTAPNDSTVTITLREPLAVFIKYLAMPVASIVPDPLPANFSEKPIGTGPWRLVEWEHDDHLRFARNDRYFGQVPAAESLLARIIPEPSTAVAEFESGNVDILNIPVADTRNWEETDAKSATLQTAAALQLWYVAINTTRGPLSDRRVRQAINHAIDVPTVVQQLMAGRGKLAAGVIPPSLDGVDAGRKPYGYDVARAKTLLAEAGHPNGIDVELWSSQSPPFPRVAETIQAYLREAGIRVTLVQREAAAVREASRAGQVDMHLKDWYADYPDAENFLYPLLHSASRGAGGNVSFYANPAYDAVVSASRRELEDERRFSLYRQADSIAFHDAPMVFLFFYNELYAVQPWIRGFQIPAIFNGQRYTGVEIVGQEER